ncbi:hypothetical protein D3C73_1055920 [compost metagenome]
MDTLRLYQLLSATSAKFCLVYELFMRPATLSRMVGSSARVTLALGAKLSADLPSTNNLPEASLMLCSAQKPLVTSVKVLLLLMKNRLPAPVSCTLTALPVLSSFHGTVVQLPSAFFTTMAVMSAAAIPAGIVTVDFNAGVQLPDGRLTATVTPSPAPSTLKFCALARAVIASLSAAALFPMLILSGSLRPARFSGAMTSCPSGTLIITFFLTATACCTTLRSSVIS